MAGDLGITERAIIETAAAERVAAARETGGQVIHRYGRVSILALPDQAVTGRLPEEAVAAEEGLPGLDEVERLGLAALRLRESAEYRSAKLNRPRAGAAWDMPSCTDVVPTPQPPTTREAAAPAPAPTSSYLEGPVAVGIVIVEGPTPELRFTDAERTRSSRRCRTGWASTPPPTRWPGSASRTTSSR